MIQEILRNSDEFQNILKDIKEGKEAHSYLFISSDKFTANEMANLVANALLCPDLCGKCENCVKFQKEHPDVKYFPKKGQLLVEDSNFIVDESFVKPIFADKKIFIIRDFDLSTPASQNKLLKVLEEPNENMFYLLSTSNPESVLPTIRSRCFKVNIKNFDKETIEKELFGLYGNLKRISVAVGGGYLGKTIELSRKENIEALFDLSLSIVTKLKASKEVVMFSKKLIDKKDDILLIFEMISLLLEDIIAIKAGQEELLKFEFVKDELKVVLNDYSLKAIAEIEKLIENVVMEFKSNANQILVVDNFLMNLLEVKYLCK